ncbi:MAG: hypothetical protein A2Y09_01720 [Planctomycetes bacterium GWA2_39_15]|nr:MAG: hypothetical protein A2Y09_01720 [Planctomycetes bacterium GWA2_39_15]
MVGQASSPDIIIIVAGSILQIEPYVLNRDPGFELSPTMKKYQMFRFNRGRLNQQKNTYYKHVGAGFKPAPTLFYG